MKMLNMFCALAVLALSSVALANNYADDVAPPSGFVNFAEDVAPPAVDPAQVAPAPEAMEVAPVENYGYAPTWSGGCCDRSYGHHDHLWDNYCAEKHCGWFGRGCCGKLFGGCGGFSKGCCQPKCCKSRSWHLPKLHLPKLHCCQKTKCCKETTCQKSKCCHRLHLPKLRLFSRHGCSKCCNGGDVIYEGQPEVNDVEAPAMDVNEVPMPPMGPAV